MNKIALESIGFYTLSDERCKNADKNSPIYRAEILLTDRCNFKCPYCRGLSSELKGDRSFDEIVQILSWLFDNKLVNVRFSGGEPTLDKNLLDYVILCRDNKVKRIALSTNGSADLDYYKKLVKYGVNDFSISLDACCASTADIMSGKRGQYTTVVSNIKELSKLTYVTVGIVFDERNISQLSDTVILAKELGVSDIRIIPSAQYNKENMVGKLQFDFIDKFPILKYRLNNHNNGISIRGLLETDNARCPLVLDDIAVAGNYHFPCIIFLREQGQAIGEIINKQGNINDIRNDREQWYQTHNCYEDKICRNNCLDICRAYSNKYAEFRKITDHS